MRHQSQRYNIGRHESAIGIQEHGLAGYPWERVAWSRGGVPESSYTGRKKPAKQRLNGHEGRK